MKHYVTGHITDGGVRVRGRVIKEAKVTEVHVFGCLCLVGRQRAKGNEHGGVDCNGILEQRIDDLLDNVERFGGKAGRRVVGFGILDLQDGVS